MITKHAHAIFIAFEGLDGSGKTTCAKRTAELLGAHFMTTPSEAMRTYRDDVLADLKGSQEAAQMFYLATVLAASREIEIRLAAGQSVVLDRYLLSTQVYAEFRGSPLRLTEEMDRLVHPADLTVFMEASRDVRLMRARQRKQVTDADKETFGTTADQQLRRGYESWFGNQVVGRLLRINSAISSTEEQAEEVVRYATSSTFRASTDKLGSSQSSKSDFGRLIS